MQQYIKITRSQQNMAYFRATRLVHYLEIVMLSTIFNSDDKKKSQDNMVRQNMHLTKILYSFMIKAVRK